MVHDSRFWPKAACARLGWWSSLAVFPAQLAWKRPAYVPHLVVLLPVVALGVLLWSVRLVLVGLSKTVTYLRFVGRPCPACSKRGWTWPGLEWEDTAW